MPKNRNIPILYAIALLQGLVFYGPIATLYRQAAGVGLGQIALIEGLSLAVSLALELPWGFLAERLGYRRTLVVCSGLYFISKLVFWRAAGFWGFLAERVLLGVVLAGLSGVDTAVLYLSCPPEQAHGVFAVYNNLSTAGLLLAAAVYTLCLGENYRLAGALTAVSYGAAALLSLALTEVRPPERAPGRGAAFLAALRGTLGRRSALSLLLAAALLSAVHQMVTVFFSQPQYVGCGMSDAAIGAAYLLTTLCGLLGGLSARLARRTGERRMTVGLFLLSAVGCAALALTRWPWLSVGAVVCLRVCFSLFQPLWMQMQNRAVQTADRATALSVNAVVVDGITIAATLLFGAVSETGLPHAMALGAVLCAAALLLAGRGIDNGGSNS